MEGSCKNTLRPDAQWDDIMDLMDQALNPGLLVRAQPASQSGGFQSHYFYYKKRNYVVRTGKTGAPYILYHKKKLYLSQMGMHRK